MKILTTAARLNMMIREHIDANPDDAEGIWPSAVYLQRPNPGGCNWNVEVNCNDEALVCGRTISVYLDELRNRYLIPDGDVTAVQVSETS